MNGIWKTWLDGWCWLVLGVGVMFAASAVRGLDAPTRLFYDAVSWPIDGQSTWTENVRFSASIIGALTIGWALTLIPLVKLAHASQGPNVWRALSFAVVAWYIVDSTVSVLAGVPGNAVSNTGFLLLFLVPILKSGVLK